MFFHPCSHTQKGNALLGNHPLVLNAPLHIQRKSGSHIHVDPKAEIPAISVKFPIPQAHFCVEYCMKVDRWAHRVFIGNIYIYIMQLQRYIRTKKSVHKGYGVEAKGRP